jgi:hypothetical protein
VKGGGSGGGRCCYDLRGPGRILGPFCFAAHARAEPGCSRRGSAVATAGLAVVGGRACLGTHACSAATPARHTCLLGLHACQQQSLPASKPAPGPCLPLGTGLWQASGLGRHSPGQALFGAGVLRWQAFTRAGMITGRLPRVVGVCLRARSPPPPISRIY